MHWKEYYYLCMMRLFFCLFFSFSLGYSKAQINNIVPNPSFEYFSNCPQNAAQLEYAVPWFSPITPLCTSEYFNACCTIAAIDGGVSVPDNAAAYQTARTGNAYAGIAIYVTGKQREYIEVELTEALKANSNYCVEFYYSLSEFTPVFIDYIGGYFSSLPMLSDSSNALPVIPQVYLPVVIDSINWVQFFSSFTATGGEKYITIGNFEPHFIQQGLVYVFIDDVSVYLCDDTLPEQPKEIKIPNVFSPNADGVNDLFEIENLAQGAEVSIYNRWGALVFESNNPNNFWDGRTKGGTPVPGGIYYYIVKIPGSESKKGFVELIR
jgi:gliding motility-associated-like protein